MYFLQNSLVFPGASTQGKPEADVSVRLGEELLHLRTAHGETIAVLFGPALSGDGSPHAKAASQPTLLYFYGNAMSISACSREFEQFRRMGNNVAIAEFVGYGLSTGTPSEVGVYDTADAAYQHLLSRKDIDAGRIIPVGWSLGAAAAIHLASTKPVAALATFSAFTSMPDMGRHILPWLPTSLLIKYRFDNEAKMANVKCPVFLAHGSQDSLVPFAMNARLANALHRPATVVPVTNGDHNDIFEVGGRDLMKRFGEFVENAAAR